ncbi:nose resistant to fluoxetine protein 6 [Rhipicephalus sanguineus]|uniref:nose resistant to fluoxetine protein 6 n=1 Tax=Rhipicephalus sanguineus TaxID=34632 RepID=UPI0020C3A616|nr:nose resistant to fluoxetine protein 6 [Rhipicephalus sanguineus]
MPKNVSLSSATGGETVKVLNLVYHPFWPAKAGEEVVKAWLWVLILLRDEHCCFACVGVVKDVYGAAQPLQLLDNATTALWEHLSTLAPARTTLSPEEQEISQYGKTLRNVMARAMASIPDSVRTKLLGADVRPECSVGLLRTMRAFQNLEPWAFRRSLITAVKAFSLVTNTRMLLRTAKRSDGDHYALQFLHGLRFFSLVHIVLGHCYETITDTTGTLMNILILSDRWLSMLIAAAFNSVETFFFLSGFFLCLTVGKRKANPMVIFIMGALRRVIRICVPLFFIIMCLCLLPVIVTGPDTKSFYQKLYVEVSSQWWHYVLQIRNFYELGTQHVLGHTWYLSADFQLFVVSLLTLALLQGRKTLAIGTFALLSLLGYGIAAWELASSNALPFMIFPAETPERTIVTVHEYYILPFIHALPYFSGCITFLIMDDFRERKITKTMQAAGWCIAASCGLCCVFMKLAWYKSPDPTSKAGTLLAAFSDRAMWSFLLAWITLTCSSGRGGPVGKFLSWNLFVPLSKLSFGVYLIHYPFIELLLHSSRERMHWSDFNQVTMLFSVLDWSFILAYFSYLACEAPTAALDKLAFSKLTGGGRARKQKRRTEVNEDSASPEKKKEDVFSRC